VSGLVFGAVDNFLERGFEFMNVSFGCTGGQHRSVFFTEKLASLLEERYGDRVKVDRVHHTLATKGMPQSGRAES
jgi:UPF0042 nucleotide-binding protein